MSRIEEVMRYLYLGGFVLFSLHIHDCDAFMQFVPIGRSNGHYRLDEWSVGSPSCGIHRISTYCDDEIEKRFNQQPSPWKVRTIRNKAIRKWTTSPSPSSLYSKWNKPNSKYYNNEDDDFYFPPAPPRNKGRKKLRYNFQSRNTNVQKILVYTNTLCFALQILSAINYLPNLNAVLQRSGYRRRPIAPLDILEMMVWGKSPIIISGRGTPSLGSRGRAYGQPLIVSSSLGPFTMDFCHQVILTRLGQAHRYLTSGFLHGSLLHLLVNMRTLWSMPRWLENGLGWRLYLTTYLFSIWTGNVAQTYVSNSAGALFSLCLGASGGICGLNGLMYVMLNKMGNTKDSMKVFKNMIILVIFGSIVDGVSNAAHIGGFIGGALVAHFFGPNYGKSYAMTRKWSLASDDVSAEYRSVMGFGKVASDQGDFPLWYLWGGLGLAFLTRPELRTIPGCLLIGIFQPGVLSGMFMDT